MITFYTEIKKTSLILIDKHYGSLSKNTRYCAKYVPKNRNLA